MRPPRFIGFLIAVVVGTSALVLSQSPPVADRSPTTASNLRIVAPANGQKLAVDYVNVQYQITNTAANPNTLPTFQASLDGNDPVITSVLAHTFTGLVPGEHKISVQMVDANSLPVAGTQTEVHFVVVAPQQQNSPMRSSGESAEARPTSPQLREANASVSESSNVNNTSMAENLPTTSSGLPLLSVIGFGVLVGGIASALKTR